MEDQMKIYRPRIEDGTTDYMAYINIREEYAAEVDAGTFTSGAWRTRTLNTITTDDTGSVTLSSNQFTLPAGTYLIHCSVPAYYCDEHKAALYNITDSEFTLIGSSEFIYMQAAASVHRAALNSSSYIQGKFTIDTSTTFEIRHRCNYTAANNGMGNSGVGDWDQREVYTDMELWKLK